MYTVLCPQKTFLFHSYGFSDIFHKTSFYFRNNYWLQFPHGSDHNFCTGEKMIIKIIERKKQSLKHLIKSVVDWELSSQDSSQLRVIVFPVFFIQTWHLSLSHVQTTISVKRNAELDLRRENLIFPICIYPSISVRDTASTKMWGMSIRRRFFKSEQSDSCACFVVSFCNLLLWKKKK